jgi:hypothetical protein
MKLASLLLTFLSLTPLVHAKTELTGLDIQNAKGITATSVKIDKFIGNIIIKNLDAKEVILEAHGPENILKLMHIESDDDELHLSFDEDVTLKTSDKLELIIQMPRTMPLDLSLSAGAANVSDRQAKTTLDVSGSGVIKAASVDGDLKSHLKGSGNLDVGKVHGTVDIEIMGAGSAHFKSGKIDKLSASVKGAGNIDFEGEAGDADLEIMGAGSITVEKVTGKVTQNAYGAGKITVNSSRSLSKNEDAKRNGGAGGEAGASGLPGRSA